MSIFVLAEVLARKTELGLVIWQERPDGPPLSGNRDIILVLIHPETLAGRGGGGSSRAGERGANRRSSRGGTGGGRGRAWHRCAVSL